MLNRPRTKVLAVTVLFLPLLCITSAPSLIGEWSQDVAFNWRYLVLTSVISVSILLWGCHVFGVHNLRLHHKLTRHQLLAAGLVALTVLITTIALENIPQLSPMQSGADSAAQLLRGTLRWPMIVALCVTGPICEELAFRGILQGALQSALPRAGAITITAVVFAVCHGVELVNFIALTGISIAFSALNQRFNDTRTSILSHMIYNAIMTVIALLIS
ncbi:CPBP family intramembrane glutamic endopeptidase [Lacticaseibacillus pantheris]|uniref:CPBP family intramembrane glutamic endopeptidase n=1 Tax=Lacticaseibacillus pantheris TaxID=171523 RepID=UPI0034548B3E